MARILVMEDDISLGLEMVERLEQAGHEVTVRFSAREADEEFRSNPYDVVITDLIVYDETGPVPDGGVTLIHKLRHGKGMRDVSSPPIIAISGAWERPGMQSILGTAVAIGANFAMRKPVDYERLLTTIQQITVVV